MKTKIIIGIMVLIGIFLLKSCKEPEIPFETSDDLLIGEYIEIEEDYSLFYEMLELTENVSFLKAYGTYTCLVPDNNAVEMFLEKKGKSSLSEIGTEELKKIVRYHIIIDTINSTTFTDGKLPKANMYGQFLTVRTYFEGGRTVKKINKYAEMDKLDILLANGIVHTIKTVLEPITISVAELIEQDPSFSIFTAALKETGLYDTLSHMPDGDIIGREDSIRWFTVLVESDSVLNAKGIYSLQDMIDEYGSLEDHTDPSDSLYLHMAYHILDYSLKYVSDLMQDPAHLTFAPLEVITIKIKKDSVLVNEDIFNNILEKGAPINRPESDNTAGNGVFHELSRDIFIKVRFPQRVYFDVCRQSEIMKMPGVYGNTVYQEINLGDLADVTWNADIPIYYEGLSTANKVYHHTVYHDWFNINFRTAAISEISFTTPIVVKGWYYVWICSRNQEHERKPKYRVYVNDEGMGTLYDWYRLQPSIPDDEYFQQGLKRYSYYEADSMYFYNAEGYNTGQLAGKIEIKTTGQQTVTLKVINNGDKGLWLDMIQFVPVDEEDQLWPRIDEFGVMIDRPEGY